MKIPGYELYFAHMKTYAVIDKMLPQTPIIQVVLKGLTDFSHMMKVDSGADFSLLSMEYFQMFTNDSPESVADTPIGGVGGRRTAKVISPIKAIIETENNYEVECNITVGFVEDSRYSMCGLLGRKGLFDKFTIAFQSYPNECLYLQNNRI